MTACPKCTNDVADNMETCPCCGVHAGFPNVKIARSEAAALGARVVAARTEADGRGATLALEGFEQAVAQSHAVANVPGWMVEQFLSGDQSLYATYGKLVAAGVRTIASLENDQDRTAVEGRLFGLWGSNISYAALALDGRGVTNYGEVSLELRELAIADRASVMEDNSYKFAEKHDVKLRNPAPQGYRAPWGERAATAVAKLAKRIEPTTTAAEHARLLLAEGTTRADDEFIEVHIYGAFNRRAIEKITLLAHPPDEFERKRLEKVKELAQRVGIVWSEP